MARVVLTGVEQAQMKILEVDQYTRNHVAAKMLDAAATVVKNLASERAPAGRTGELGASMEITGSGPVDRFVGPGKRAFYGRFVERGTPERTQKTTGKSTGSVAPQRFLRPALDDPQVVNEASKTFKVEMGKVGAI